MKRDKWVHIKVSEAERSAWHSRASENEITLSDLVRQQMGAAEMVHREPVIRRRIKRVDPELIRALAKIGNNLNQIARWANTHKAAADAIAVVRALLSVEHELFEIPTQPNRRRMESDAH